MPNARLTNNRILNTTDVQTTVGGTHFRNETRLVPSSASMAAVASSNDKYAGAVQLTCTLDLRLARTNTRNSGTKNAAAKFQFSWRSRHPRRTACTAAITNNTNKGGCKRPQCIAQKISASFIS